jgi:asparagine synthase (glutamine-hydrolysing)
MLPIDFMYQEGVGQKLILRNILYKKLPEELFERKKRGFGVPLVHWFRNDLKDYVQDILNKETLLNIPEYDIKLALHLINNHMTGKENHTTFIWLCINYLLWLDYYNKVINM